MERLDAVISALNEAGVSPNDVRVAIGPNEMVKLAFRQLKHDDPPVDPIDLIDRINAGLVTYMGYTLCYRRYHGEPDVRPAIV